MITRIRYVKIRPGTVEAYKQLAFEWQTLIHKYGGRVLGFYHNQQENEVVGIAEYTSEEQLAEIQSNCEAHEAFPRIKEQVDRLVVSGEELILDKLELGGDVASDH